MSSTAILAEMKSDSLQYLAVLSLNRISISASEIKLPLALTFWLFLTYPELHFKTFFRSSDSNYFFNEGERFHEYCDYDKLLICTMAEITQFCPRLFRHKRLRHV